LKASVCALIGLDCGLSSEQNAILFDIRLPRILLAGLVGTCLATAGAGYQALLRNPLAEPYLLGVSNGAAVGTMTALVFFGAHEWSRPVFAFAGALIASFVVYQLARGRRRDARPSGSRRRDRHHLSFFSDRFHHDFDGRNAHSIVPSGCWAIYRNHQVCSW
jgi:ABC-type Fe3+-siderophore transport system permease subunit